MNYAMVLHMLGWVSCFEAGFLMLPLLVSLIYRESCAVAFLATAALCVLAGILLLFRKPAKRSLSAKDGLVIVALSWIWLSVFGALPFVISGEIPFYIDALFETVSGFTTTGASILVDVEALSHGTLFWRSFTHWIGGMGVLVFILAILPMKGGSSIFLMKAESPGPSVSKLVPKMRDTAFILYAIYFVMTIIQCVLLLLGGMPLFDTLCTAFGTAGTGGFGIKADSFGSYSPYLQGVVAVFMMLFGINFNLYYLILRRKLGQAITSVELLAYLAIITIATGSIAFDVLPMFDSVGEALHHAFFQVSSIITTTGFATTDFNLWPGFSKTVLVTLMFVGACAGSTGGGIKVSRILIMLKEVVREVRLACHPRSIRKVKLDGRTVEHDVIRSVNSYMVVYLVLFVASVLIVSIDEFDLVTNFTAVATTINNVGPGLANVGPAGNFSAFSPLAKLVMSFDMLAGRLELMPMLMLFVPATWKRK